MAYTQCQYDVNAGDLNLFEATRRIYTPRLYVVTFQTLPHTPTMYARIRLSKGTCHLRSSLYKTAGPPQCGRHEMTAFVIRRRAPTVTQDDDPATKATADASFNGATVVTPTGLQSQKDAPPCSNNVHRRLF
jgi:hypothetical protein